MIDEAVTSKDVPNMLSFTKDIGSSHGCKKGIKACVAYLDHSRFRIVLTYDVATSVGLGGRASALSVTIIRSFQNGKMLDSREQGVLII